MIALKLAILAPLFIFAVFGLVFDGGRVVNARASLDDVAASAARAAQGGVERGPGGEVVFGEEAIALAEAYISRQTNVTGTATLLSDTTVQVTVSSSYDPVIIPGQAAFQLEAVETAESQLGVRDDGDV